MTFLGFIRESSSQGKTPPSNLETQAKPHSHSYDLLTGSRSFWSYKLIGTLKWQFNGSLKTAWNPG